MQATRSPAGIGATGRRWVVGIEMIHRVALQPADLDGLLVVAMHHASAFAQAHPRGRRASNSAREYSQSRIVSRGAAQISAGDFLDEARHVDVRRAGGGAGRVETV